MITAPVTMSTACQSWTSRTLTSIWASTGFVSAWSSFPSRTSSVSRIMFGWITEWITPAITAWTPSTARSSECVQPLSSVVCEKTSWKTTSPTVTAMSGLEDLEREVDPVLEVLHQPDAEMQQRDAKRGHQFPTAV